MTAAVAPRHTDVSAAVIQAGIAAHRAGRLDEAKQAYLNALRIDAECSDAWHLLGVVVQQLGEPAVAIQFIARAIEIAPSHAVYYANLAAAMHALHRLDDAVTLYREALRIDSRLAEAACNLGKTLQQLERDAEALEAYRHAIDADPGHGDAHFGCAQLLTWRGLHDDAMHAFARMLTAQSLPAAGRCAYARALLKQDRLGEAREQYAAYKSALPASSRLKGTPAELLPLSTAQALCAQRGWRYLEVLPARTLCIPQPRFVNPAVDVGAATGRLHALYVAELRDAEAFGWHDLVVANAPRKAVYDLAARDTDDTVECEDALVQCATTRHAIVDGVCESGLELPRARLLAGRGWDSYAHWLIEFLPRLMLFEQAGGYGDWPVLVDAGLRPQQLEGLRLLLDEAQLVPLPAHTRCRVGRLALASDPSGMRMQSYRPRAVPSARGAVVAPEALTFLRERFLGAACGSPALRHGRRLYISRRRQTAFRRLLNEAQLEALFTARGFEVVYPEELSFKEQVRLFSAAAVVAGPAGSNMINLVFAPPGARILLLAMWHPRLNYHFFANLAHLLGQDLVHVLGRIVALHEYYYQSDFEVDARDVERGLKLLDVD